MYIYVIRHGETYANLNGYFQGWTDDPLTDNGRRLAVITGKRIKEKGIKFDCCYSSPLSRAKETADIVLRESGNEIPVILDDRLKEVNMGDWEKKHFRDGEREVDKDQMELMYLDPFAFGGCPNGEQFTEVIERSQELLNEIIARDDDKTYLLATHGVTFRCILNSLYEDPSDLWQGVLPYNCAVSIIEAKGGKAKLIEDNIVFYDEKDIVDLIGYNAEDH